MSTMSSDELRKAVMLVRPDVEPLGKLATLLLSETRAPEPRAFGDEAASYVEALNNTVLAWMAEGKHDQLRRLGTALQTALGAEARHPRVLSRLPVHDQLAIRIDVVMRQIAQLLHGENPAKYVWILSGQRYQKWRELLVGLHKDGEHGRPVRRSQAHEFVDGGMSRQAGEKAVDKLVELGLLTKIKAGRKHVGVELTWAGRRLAQECLAPPDVGIETKETTDLNPLRGECMTTSVSKVGLPEFEREDGAGINRREEVAA